MKKNKKKANMKQKEKNSGKRPDDTEDEENEDKEDKDANSEDGGTEANESSTQGERATHWEEQHLQLKELKKQVTDIILTFKACKFM